MKKMLMAERLLRDDPHWILSIESHWKLDAAAQLVQHCQSVEFVMEYVRIVEMIDETVDALHPASVNLAMRMIAVVATRCHEHVEEVAWVMKMMKMKS